MNHDQLYFYLKHRLSVAGRKGSELFNRKVCGLMHKACRGTPRIVNVVAHKALMLAYGEGKEAITQEHVKLAILDTDACVQPNPNRKLLVLLAIMASILLGVLVFNYLTGDKLL